MEVLELLCEQVHNTPSRCVIWRRFGSNELSILPVLRATAFLFIEMLEHDNYVPPRRRLWYSSDQDAIVAFTVGHGRACLDNRPARTGGEAVGSCERLLDELDGG
jgi:hypothetical protein